MSRYTLQLFTRENTVNKEISVMNEPVHVAVGLQLLEMCLSQHLPKNFECLHKVHFSEFFFLKIIGDFTELG